MMDAAYFTSRKDILDWINNLLNLKLTKIEQTASGAVACQLADYIFPGSINTSRVNWEAKNDYDYVNNYKLLQDSFNKHKVQRFVDVNKLIRGKYQDNLEFMQWYKGFFHSVCKEERLGYDPVKVRCKGKGGKDTKKHMDAAALRGGTKLLPSDREAAKALKEASENGSGVDNSETDGNDDLPAPPKAAAVKKVRPDGVKREVLKDNSNTNTNKTATGKDGLSGAPVREKNSSSSSTTSSSSSSKEHRELVKAHTELRTTVSGLEKERDFYFDKLRDIEIMLQSFQEKEEGADSKKLIEDVFLVLYATTEEKIRVNDEGEIVGQAAAAAAVIA